MFSNLVRYWVDVCLGLDVSARLVVRFEEHGLLLRLVQRIRGEIAMTPVVEVRA